MAPAESESSKTPDKDEKAAQKSVVRTSAEIDKANKEDVERTQKEAAEGTP